MHDFLSTNELTDLSGEFTKYQGNGNDFVIFEISSPLHLELLSPIAQKICDRHRGVGADGVILLSHAEKWHMSLFNQDGSIAKNCGNGLRCVADYLFKKTGLDEVLLSFYARDYRCYKKGSKISVQMGVAQVFIEPMIFIDNLKVEVAQVSLGNAHKVLLFDQPVDPKGLIRAVRKLFPDDGLNIGFIFTKDGRFFSEVYESGVGFTNSCGTGACAKAAFLAALDVKKYDRSILIEQPGGEIEVNSVKLEQVGDVHMFQITQTGNAQAVFSGYWPKNDELIGRKTVRINRTFEF